MSTVETCQQEYFEVQKLLMMYKYIKKELKYNGENLLGITANDLMKNSNKNADGTVDGLLTGKDQTNNAGATIDYIHLNNNAANVMMT